MRRSAMSRRGKRSDVPSSSAAWATVRSRSFSGNVVHPLPLRAIALVARRVQRAERNGEWVASPGEVPLGEGESAVLCKVGHEPGGYGLFALVGGAGRRPPRRSPAPAARRSSPSRTPVDRACQSGRAVLYAPGMLSPRKVTVRALRPAASASPASQAQTLDWELPGKIGTYRGGWRNVGTL